MNKNHFDAIQKAQDDYIRRIDNLAAAQAKEAETDYIFADAVKRDRLEARREAAQFAMSDGMKEAWGKVQTEIDAMREAFRRYLTAPADPAQLATLRALLDSGLELTDREIQAYADMGNYTILRLIQPHAKGHIKLPSFDEFEHTMARIKEHFDILAAYSGPNNELADFVTVRPWGQGAIVNGAVLKGSIPKFPALLADFCDRWSMIEG